MTHDRAFLLLAVCSALTLPFLAACETGGPVDAGPPPPDAPLLQPDGGQRRDAGPPPDSGPPPECTAEGMGATIGMECARDADCDDACFCNGIELCSAGTCVEGLACESSGCATASCDEDSDTCTLDGDDSMCDDGVFCNGPEVCDGAFGCRPGVPPFCSDGDFCTIDFCDEDAGSCGTRILDGDGDGYAGATCGGLDCNDAVMAISPDATEICGNSIDDDCNGMIDIADPVCQPTNDTCVDSGDGRGPEDITPAGNGTFTFVRSTLGLNEDVDPSCTLSSLEGPDAIFSFTLTEAKDVAFRVLGVGDDATVALRTLADCAVDTDLRCNNPSSSSATPAIARPNLPAGDYVVIVETEGGPSTFTLEMTLSDSSGVQNDFCGPDLLDISAGGTFSGTIAAATIADDLELDCRGTTLDYQEVIFQFVIPAGEARDVSLMGRTFNGDLGRRAWLAVLDTCASSMEDEEVGCTEATTNGESASLTLRSLPEGTYFVVLEADFTSDTRYELDVAITPPAGRTPGDSCDVGNPVEVSGGPGSIEVADLVEGPDVGAFCGANRAGYRDGFFEFTLAADSDVVVTTTGDVRHWAGVSSTCGAMELDRYCFYAPSGSGTESYLRLAAGTYYLNVSTLASSGTISAEVQLLPPTPVPGNNTCGAATTIADGVTQNFDLSTYEHSQVLCGGDTDTFDAFYTFTLATQRFVSIRAEGAAGVALLDACGSSPVQCDTGNPPRIERIVDPGTYVIAVLEPAAAAGPVTLRFNTSDP